MPVSVAVSHPATSFDSAPPLREPIAIATDSNGFVLPHDGEPVAELPAAVAAATAQVSSLRSDREDHVFCDPAAFRYLEAEPHVSVVQRCRQISGYELYLVEQWACSRTDPTFVICTYTGDSSHLVTVSVLRIPKDRTLWSRKLSVYFDSLQQYARPKETHLGTIMVTNLSSFPSVLSVVHVPGGDVKSRRSDFIVSEDLKRMGCSGRSAVMLATPTDAIKTKFHQRYRTSDRIPTQIAVVELVRLCQLALMVFDKLKRSSMIADGLLCDVTEKGIWDWWAEFGTDLYNVEPNDGMLGPTTVAGLLGMTLGARNRLGLCGAPVPKDGFDLPQLEKAIIYFQRQQRLERTGRLDRATVDRLHGTTTKSGPSADIFAVPRAIKSTVADLSARAVGNSGSTDVTAVETVDIERFVRHLSGESCKFLWQGKPRKTASFTAGVQLASPSPRASLDGRPTGSLSGDDELTLLSVAVQNRGQDFVELQPHHGSNGSIGHQVHHSPSGSSVSFPSNDTGRDATVSDLRKAVFKSMSGKMKDVASGISAGAGYMRGRGHQRAQTKDLQVEFGSTPASPIIHQQQQQTGRPSPAPPSSTESIRADRKAGTPPSPQLEANGVVVQPERAATSSPPTSILNLTTSWNEKFPPPQAADSVKAATGENSVGSSVNGVVPSEGGSVRSGPKEPKKANRRRSCEDLRARQPHHELFFPSRLSFSLVSEAVLTWDLPFPPPDPHLIAQPLREVCNDDVHWSEMHLSELQSSLLTLDKNMGRLNAVLESKCKEVGMAEREGRFEIEAEREKVRDAIREAEVLGARMQYELGVVQGKLLDLEEAVATLAKFVHEIEAEVTVLGDDEEEGTRRKKSWFTWLLGR